MSKSSVSTKKSTAILNLQGCLISWGVCQFKLETSCCQNSDREWFEPGAPFVVKWPVAFGLPMKCLPLGDVPGGGAMPVEPMPWKRISLHGFCLLCSFLEFCNTLFNYLMVSSKCSKNIEGSTEHFFLVQINWVIFNQTHTTPSGKERSWTNTERKNK